MNFHEEARALEMVREDRKWYENEAATEEALQRAYVAGVNDAIVEMKRLRREGWPEAPNCFKSSALPSDFYRGQPYEEG